jgi:hypothetical protein
MIMFIPDCSKIMSCSPWKSHKKEAKSITKL